MHPADFFADKRTQIPKSWDGHDFPAFIGSMLDDYSDALEESFTSVKSSWKGSREAQAFRRESESMRNSLVQSCSEFLDGDVHRAYNTLKTELTKTFSHALQRNIISLEKDQELFFRARCSEEAAFTKEELFHIPFDKRHLVGSERFSVIDLPCLYVSGSLFTCWHELNAPPLHKLQCSGLWIKRNEGLKVIDLRHPFSRLRVEVNKADSHG